MNLKFLPILTFVGIIMMTVFGSFIARHIGVEQWQLAGFATGLILVAVGPTWELRRRLSALEAEIEKSHNDKGRESK